jgi:hypothetical protein
VPLTIAAGREVELNLNLGWEWNRAGAAASRAFWGGQVVWSPSPALSLMAEGFGYSDGTAGWQAGVRWTPVAWLDLDLLGGRLDTASRHVLTLGVTTRF